jgi:superfamily II DNA or RNA helicase
LKGISRLRRQPIADLLWASRLPQHVVRALSQYGYEIRDYQAEAVCRSISMLTAGTNVGISLPPGTGKTLISQIIATLWLERHQERTERVLCIVPNTNLLMQHYVSSNWAFQGRLWNPLKVDTEWRNNKQISHDTEATEATVWFALPSQLERGLERGDIRNDLINSISLIVVDEFDSFSKVILSEEGEERTLAFKEQMLSLGRALGERERRFVFMSATPPPRPERKKREARNIWDRKYAPTYIDIPKDRYQRFIPVATVIPVGISDAKVYAEDRWIRREIAQRLVAVQEGIVSVTGVTISPTLLFDRIEEIIRYKSIKIGKAKPIKLRLETIQACYEFKLLKHYRLNVFEDLSSNLSTNVRMPEEATRLAENIRFLGGMKINALASRIEEELLERRRVVVFIRFVETIIGIASVLRQRGINLEFVFGEQEPVNRQAVLNEFKAGRIRVLIASRELFGRGFDLPEADTAIFYSPKDNVRTIWQEFLRIRSTHHNSKRIYVFFYLWTAESAKMERLLRQMWMHGANRKKTRKHQYVWEFSEDARSEDAGFSSMWYFDWDAQEAAAFQDEEYAAKPRNTNEQQSAEPNVGDEQGQWYSSYGDGQESGAEREQHYRSGMEAPTTRFEAAEKFCKGIVDGLCRSAQDTLHESLTKIAKESKLVNFYVMDAVTQLLSALGELVDSSRWTKASGIKARIGMLIRISHPDHNSKARSDAMTLYNDLTACLIELRQASR